MKAEVELLEKNILAYNASTRCVLADKSLLSYILKKYFHEYKNLERDVIEKLIGPNIYKNDEIHKIYGLSNDDTSFLDGTVRYDLLFTVGLENDKSKIGIIFNLELQDEVEEADLKRMNYYAARILTSEKNRIFLKDEYKDITKVCAIWLCIRPPKNRKNSINYYSFKEEHIVGNYQAKKEHYDLINILTIYLGDSLETEELQPFNILFKANLKPEEIFEMLDKNYDIHLHIETREEVKSMCNLGEGIYKQGVDFATIQHILNLMASFNMSIEQVMDGMKLSDEDKIKYKTIILNQEKL